MSLSLQLHENDNHFSYQVYRDGACVASLEGHRHVLNTLMAIFQWEGAVDEAEVRDALVARIYADCKQAGTEVLIHLSDTKKTIYEAFCAGGFVVNYENYLFRKELTDLPSPSRLLTLRAMLDMPATQYQALFQDSNRGDPRFGGGGLLSPEAFLNKYIAEIGNLYHPDGMFAACLEGVPVGVVNFRVTESHGIVAGFMNYIGIHPDYRGQGLGVDLHRTGLQRLKEMGCSTYLGGTPENNLVMQAVFRRNEVPLRAKQVYMLAKL